MPTIIRIVKFFQKVIEEYLLICYNACVVQPTPVNGRGCLHGAILHISCDCRGRCGFHLISKRRIPRLYAITVGGFVLCLHGILHISLPIGIIAYANFNCKIHFFKIKFYPYLVSYKSHCPMINHYHKTMALGTTKQLLLDYTISLSFKNSMTQKIILALHWPSLLPNQLYPDVPHQNLRQIPVLGNDCHSASW